MPVLGLLLTAGTVSAAVARGRLEWVIGALIAATAMAVGLYNWRWSVLGLLSYMPFSGIPILLGLPNAQIAVLLKDLLFVLPTYTGYLLARRRKGLSFPGSPLYPLLAGLALLVAVESLQTIRQPLVAAVGAKVWLMYMPLLFLGYHLIYDRSRLTSLLGLMSVLALIPAGVGIVEAVLLDSGRSDLVYGWYGAAARSVTQNFVQFDFSSPTGRLLRVPSLFSSVFQYYDFVASTSAISFAWWQLTRRRLALCVWLIMLLACFSSGARAAFVLTPLMMGITLLLSRSAVQAAALVTGVGSVLIIAAALIGLSAGDLVFGAIGVGTAEVSAGFVNGVPTALQSSLIGMGTGIDTWGARYVLGDAGPIVAGLSYSESWYVKVILELGIGGLLLFGLVFGWLLLRGYHAHQSLSEPGLRAVSASLLALLVWTLAYSLKGPQFDLDPVNVYFWLFAGVLLKISAIHIGQSRRRLMTVVAETDIDAVAFELRPTFS
jgi:hypothetical protein